MATHKSEFENVGPGYTGVNVKGENGQMTGISVAPSNRIWLDEDEQIATANAPRDDADNPFANGRLKLVTPATEIVNRRPIGDTTGEQPPPSPEPPEADAPAEPEPAPVEETPAAKAQREAEENARAASARRRAPAPGDPVQPTPAPETKGTEVKASQQKPTSGERAKSEEVGTPAAQE